MTGPEEQSSPSNPGDGIRAGDADREATAEQLRRAVSEGRIDLAELDERIEQVYQARTYGELRAVTGDLPAALERLPPRDAVQGPETLVLKTTAPNLKQAGRWTVPRTIIAETRTGIITIDFTQASCAHDRVVVEAVTWTGWIRLILPEGWAARSAGPARTPRGSATRPRPRRTPARRP